MNSVNLIGRATKDADVRATQSGESVAKYTLAVDRPTKGDGPKADFISCVCFGKTADFAQRYIKKGTKIGITGRIQTGNYTNKDGVKIYTTDVVVNSHTFCEKVGSETVETPQAPAGFLPADDFDGLPFN